TSPPTIGTSSPSTCAERVRSAAACVIAAAVTGCGGSGGSSPTTTSASSSTAATVLTAPTSTTTTAARQTPRPRPHRPFAVGVRILTFIDSSRTVQYPGQAPQPRRLVTIVRYPAPGRSGRSDVPNAAPERQGGPV